MSAGLRKRLEARSAELTSEIEAAESRIAEIDELFCDPELYTRSAPDAIAALNGERAALQQRVEALMQEWEQAEQQLQVGKA